MKSIVIESDGAQTPWGVEEWGAMRCPMMSSMFYNLPPLYSIDAQKTFGECLLTALYAADHGKVMDMRTRKLLYTDEASYRAIRLEYLGMRYDAIHIAAMSINVNPIQYIPLYAFLLNKELQGYVIDNFRMYPEEVKEFKLPMKGALRVSVNTSAVWY